MSSCTKGMRTEKNQEISLSSLYSAWKHYWSFWMTAVSQGTLTSQSGKLRLLTLKCFAMTLMGGFSLAQQSTSLLTVVSNHIFPLTQNYQGGTWRKLKSPNLQQSSTIYQMEGAICSAWRSRGSKRHELPIARSEWNICVAVKPPHTWQFTLWTKN